ncbi:hypothetical protein ACFL00_00320 [Pseudomonadota bacterium]
MLERIIIGVLCGFILGAFAARKVNSGLTGAVGMGCIIFAMWSIYSGVLYFWLAVVEIGLGAAVGFGLFGGFAKKSE